MNKRTILGVVILAMIAFYIGFLIHLSNNKQSDLQYKIESISIKGEGDKYKIDAEYPIIVAGVSPEVKYKINEYTKDWVENSVNLAKKDFDNLAREINILSPETELLYIGKVKVISDIKKLPFISVYFDTYYYSGGAHGINEIKTFVFNSYNGSIINLNDLFVGEYLKVLSELSLDELKAKDEGLKNYSFAEEGTSPDIDNFKTFTLESDGMHIVFGDYQVGPYVVGHPEIVISYEKLKEVLNPRVYSILISK